MVRMCARRRLSTPEHVLASIPGGRTVCLLLPLLLPLDYCVCADLSAPAPFQLLATPASKFNPPTPKSPLVLPPWTPTYNLSLSTALFPTNQSGWWDATLTRRFGLLNFVSPICCCRQSRLLLLLLYCARLCRVACKLIH